MKIFLIIGAVLVVLGGLLAGVVMKLRGASEPQATAVRVAPALRGELIEIVSAPGQVQPRTKVSISAKVSARIVELPFDEGQKVTRGDPNASPPVPASILVKLDASDLDAQLRAARALYAAQEAQLLVAQAQIAARTAQIAASNFMLADARRDLDRQKGLLETKDVSQMTVDQAQTKVDQQSAQLDAAVQELEAQKENLNVLRHQLDAADADIARAQDMLSYTTITSPIDGVVTRINAKVGELVVTGTMNNPGTVIMEVADLSAMLVDARIDESSIAQLAVGQPAKVRTQAYPNEVFDGVVDSVALAQTQEMDGSSYYKTEVLLKTDGRQIFTGLTADVEIETQKHENVLKVPSQAVVGRSVDSLPADIRTRPEVNTSKTFAAVVYRYIDGKAVVTPVTIGTSDLTHTLITSGLSEGDRIITGPFKALDLLQHDQKVKEETAATQPS